MIANSFFTAAINQKCLDFFQLRHVAKFVQIMRIAVYR